MFMGINFSFAQKMIMTDDDKSLSTIDVDGIALSGIKDLIQENNALKRDKSIKSKL